MATYVVTASIYVDHVEDEEAATKAVETACAMFYVKTGIQIRLTDNTLIGPEGWDESESHWELVSTDDEEL